MFILHFMPLIMSVLCFRGCSPSCRRWGQFFALEAVNVYVLLYAERDELFEKRLSRGGLLGGMDRA